MKGHSIINTAIPLLILAVFASTSEALSAQDTCQIVKNGTYIADPASCQGWAYCLNGEAYFGQCGKGLFYDAASGVCDYQENVQCSANVTTMCTGLSNVFKADPTNCQNYCYCYDGVTYCDSCDSGQYFNSTLVACVYAQDSSCVPSSPCLLAQNGFIKDTRSCNGWIRCAGGQVVANGTCPDGYYYNAYTAQCDYPVNVPCSSAPSPGSPSSPTAPNGTCDGVADKYFVADTTMCRGYFFCVNASDTSPKWGQCPKNTQFNQATQQCNDPYTFACPEDRCDNMSVGFMAVANTTCNQYYICKSGVSTGIGECPDGYLYFNEMAQACQTAEFDYPICEAATAD